MPLTQPKSVFFGGYCIEGADQIPYHHPSHLKFAHLLKRLNLSSMFTGKLPLPVCLSLCLARHLHISFVQDGSEKFNSD
ncbi:hypothetical protein F4678DRAFT_419635 [Xylaria arbuscula]|nr:hypothetical protein F4678DRAFT_419635 [Xylaria arbuscula]